MKHYMDTLTLHLIIIVFCMFRLPHFTVKAQLSGFLTSCNTASKFNSGSTYAHNLNRTLTSLSANASQLGFATAIFGNDPADSVYGLIQCYAYVTRDECQNCASNATMQITQRCPNKTEASITHDWCALRYSANNFFSSDQSVFQAVGLNMQNVSDPVRFNSLLDDLLNNTLYAAASSPSRVSLQTTPYDTETDIYAMMQCAPTLDVKSCSKCLGKIVNDSVHTVCQDAKGCKVLSSSCNFRYELYAFSLVYSVPSPPPPPPPPPPSQTGGTTNSTTTGSTTNSTTGNKRTTRMVIAVAASSAVVLAIICVLFGCFLMRKYTKKETEGDGETKPSSYDSLVIGLDTLKTATNDFSDEYKLGEGGFGSVYKGSLLDGQEIAVKRLSKNSGQGLEELKTEVILVARLLHRNLVKLVGFCLEEEEKLLVYEYLPNGSLDKILFDGNRRSSLEWNVRFKIIVGIARGLLYLHEDSQMQVIHRDLKASNILLDEQMNPKISDFGLARLSRGSKTHGNTIRIAGTYGYMAPEYARRGHFSIKSDVYSFGILVLEIVTGRKNSSFRSSMNPNRINPTLQTWQHWVNGTGIELVDQTLGDEWERNEALKCIQIGLLCVQDGAADRPTMSEAMMMLISSNIITTSSPKRPAFCTLPNLETGQNPESVAQESINEVTITESYPR